MPYRPVAELRGPRPRYITLSQASTMLGGVLSPGVLRDLVRAGRVPGAIKAGHQYWVPRIGLNDLIVDMSAGDQHAPTAFDAKRAG